MTPLIYVLTILFGWNLFGAIFLMIACTQSRGPLYFTSGWEFVNPVWIYNHYQVNKFGAIMLMLWYSVICPIGTVAYWFYKLCTCGRK